MFTEKVKGKLCFNILTKFLMFKIIINDNKKFIKTFLEKLIIINIKYQAFFLFSFFVFLYLKVTYLNCQYPLYYFK